MKTIIYFALIVTMLASCAPKTKPLYYWGDYENISYKAVKSNEKNDYDNLLLSFDDIAKNTAKGTSGKIPPGICADFGYFLMQNGKEEEGKQWLMKEKELYPESSTFIDQILKMIGK